MATSRIFMGLALIVTGCGSGPVAPGEVADALTEQIETASIVFRFSAGDSVNVDWQQRYHEWATDLLGVRLLVKLRYNKYQGRGQMRSVTGRETNGFAEPEAFTVHTIWAGDGHEVTHVYTALVGRPSDFFNEGIAVAMDTDPGLAVWNPRWNGVHVHAHTRALVANGQLRSLGPILETDAFRGVPESIGYGQAGSFLLYLIDRFGMERMLTFFRSSRRDDSRARIEANIAATWGHSLELLEADWLAFVDGWTRP